MKYVCDTVAIVDLGHNPTETLLTTNDGAEAAEDDPEALLPIRTINAVESNVPAVELSRRRVVEEMEATVQRGLRELASRPLIRVQHQG